MTSARPAPPGRSTDRWSFVFEAERAFAETAGTLERLLPLVAQHVGTRGNANCMIRLLSTDRRFLNPSAVWSLDPQIEPVLRRTVAAAPIRVRPGTLAHQALNEPIPLIEGRVRLSGLGVDLRPEHEHLRDELEPMALGLLVLKKGDEPTGLVYLMRGPAQAQFTADEVDLVQELVGRASVSIGHALTIQGLQAENAILRGGTSTPRSVDDQLRSARLDALAALATGLAHDYDNLISVVRMCTNLALETMAPDDPRHEELADVRQACERAAELTPRLSLLAHRRSLQPELLDPAATVQQFRAELERVLHRQGTIQVDVADDGVVVCVDRGQFLEALTALVLHARGAARGRINVVVEAHTVTDEDLIGVLPGRYAVISVDGGSEGTASLPSSLESRSSDDRATGLGLALVAAFAQQSAGTMTTAGRPDGGTTVSLFLPVVTASPPGPSTPGTNRRLDGIETVLLVVGDVGERGRLRSVLRRFGYQVLDAATEARAVEVASTYAEEIHLIIVASGAIGLTARLASLRPNAAWLSASTTGRVAPVTTGARGDYPPGDAPADELTPDQEASQILARVRHALARRGVRG